MLHNLRVGPTALAAVAALVVSSSGCTNVKEYVHNGFKVGPNYCRPAAPVAVHWIDANDARVQQQSDDLRTWWTVFNDPVLNRLTTLAYRQNLTLREAGCRILQARAQVGIAVGELFPQQQNAFGDYRRAGSTALGFADRWDFGFNLAWELDFWGRFRRAVAAADDNLDASVEGYDQVLVTLLGDVATNYVEIRTDQERIKALQSNAMLQRGILAFIEDRLAKGYKVTSLDRDQALSNLRQTEAQIPQLEIDSRLANNRVCVLLGMPPMPLRDTLDTWTAEDRPKEAELHSLEQEAEKYVTAREWDKAIDVLAKITNRFWYVPETPKDAVVGIPAELLRRRPDVRQAERLAAAQAEAIGIADADFYPAFSINGNLGYQAQNFSDLFSTNAFNGSVGPSFNWQILNYGRIINNVRFQDARFQELVVTYQNTVLTANEEVEDGLVTFLQTQERAKLLDESVAAGQRAVVTVGNQYGAGAVDFNRYALIEQNLVSQQDSQAQARGQLAQGLIQVYRALGGGWQIRLMPAEAAAPALPGGPPPMPAEAVAPPATAVPTPAPLPPPPATP